MNVNFDCTVIIIIYDNKTFIIQAPKKGLCICACMCECMYVYIVPVEVR